MSTTYAHIIACIELGANRVPEIAERIGRNADAVRARLHELRRMGVVRPVRLWSTKRTRCRHRRGEKYKRYLLIRNNP